MQELEAIMKDQFSKSSSAKSSTFGGVKAAARIMNFTKSDLEAPILNGLTALDADLSQKVQDNMFSFENLSGVDNRSIQTLMRSVEQDQLMVALKGATEPVKEKFFGNMSTRARAMFIDEMEAKGPLRLTDVEDAQKGIMRLAKKLSDKGEIMLAGRGDDFV
jgi:flagellar motor switch protein FliG